jgi:hypothetical protein
VSADPAEETDAAVFEHVKTRCLEMLERAADAYARGESFDELMECARAGMKHVVERVAAVDLRELGWFVYEHKGRVFKQWVYRHKHKPGRVYCIAWQHRWRLRQIGYTEMSAFESDDSKKN